MNVLLLAAGLGSRLRPYTKTLPKCLMPVRGVPILKYWIDSALLLNPNFIYVNSHYLAGLVHNFINTEYIDQPVIICHEKKLLGTGLTLVSLLPELLGDSCLVAHVDNIIDFDLSDLVNAHNTRPRNSLLTAVTFITNNPKDFGIFEVNNKNIAIGFHEKTTNPPGNIANGAIYLLSKEAIALINKFKDTENLRDFSRDIIPLFCGKIFCHQINGEVVDIGTTENYLRVNNL